HFHGLRMQGSNDMDGVNGVTQCPIAENETFQYKFKLTQYGHSWYHSHYSSQYADGVAAPIVIHGPHSANWTEEWAPIIVADWHHKASYNAFHELFEGRVPPTDSILVDGTGRHYNDNGTFTGELFQQSFEEDKKYLIRIINGATDWHFHFSIDNHILTVIAADYVAVKPYNVTSLSIGVGQRFSVIVHAKPTASSPNGKYWLRTEYTTDNQCQFEIPTVPVNNTDRQRTGIISYNNAGGGEPLTNRHNVTVGCEDVLNLEPVVPWTVSAPENQHDLADNTYHAGLDPSTPFRGNLFRWKIKEKPMWLNFSDPTILNLENSTWNPEYAVTEYAYNDEEQWVYMILNSGIGNETRMLGVSHRPRIRVFL
ncbi:multicopper oxidase, partial [Plenodomus tracheiphilus IPT5]